LTPQNPIALVRERISDADSRDEELALFEAALERARAHGAPADRVRLLSGKASFLRERAQLSRRARDRLPVVVRHLFAGDYHQFGHGARSAAHDAVIGT
jgi:hypothetical protein